MHRPAQSCKCQSVTQGPGDSRRLSWSARNTCAKPNSLCCCCKCHPCFSHPERNWRITAPTKIFPAPAMHRSPGSHSQPSKRHFVCGHGKGHLALDHRLPRQKSFTICVWSSLCPLDCTPLIPLLSASQSNDAFAAIEDLFRFRRRYSTMSSID